MKLPCRNYVRVIKQMVNMPLQLGLMTLILLFTINNSSYGQDAVFSQFYANPLYLNPALTGVEQCSRLYLNYRNHPFPDFGTFSTYSFSADTYWQKMSGGLGVSMIHDSQGGLMHHTQLGVLYAYHTRFSRDWFVNFGMQVAYLNHGLMAESSNFVFPDQYNPGSNTLRPTQEAIGDVSSHNVDFSAGVLVYGRSFYAGASLHHINRPGIEVFDHQRLPAKYTLHAGYEWVPYGRLRHTDTGEHFSLSPNLVVQSQAGSVRFNYGMYAGFQSFIAGLWYHHNLKHPNSLIFMLGLQQVNYTIAYSYDYSLSGFYGHFSGAHELSVLLNFNCPAQNMKYRILNCPTF